MFSGLIETVGKVENIKSRGGNKIFTINASFAQAVKIGESVAIDGCCLTVIAQNNRSFDTEATGETLKVSTLQYRQPGDYVNLERALLPSDRLGGHFVAGHVDEVARIKTIKPVSGARIFQIAVARKNLAYLVEKGSIAVDGISLTINSIKNNIFTVNIIPHTLVHTTWQYKRAGDYVNIEYDLLGKFVRAYLENKAKGFK